MDHLGNDLAQFIVDLFMSDQKGGWWESGGGSKDERRVKVGGVVRKKGRWAITNSGKIT